MELHSDAHLPFPPDVVFAACRDDVVELLPYLPKIRTIEVASRKERGPVVELVVSWRGGGDVPGPLRAILGDSMFSWTDYATWDASAMRVDWRTETHVFTEAVRCGGSDRFLPDGAGSTLLEVRGELQVDPQRLRGVPGVIAPKVARAMEEFLVGKIHSDLALTAKGILKYLEERSSSRRVA